MLISVRLTRNKKKHYLEFIMPFKDTWAYHISQHLLILTIGWTPMQVAGVLFKMGGGGGINKILGSTLKSTPLPFCIPFLTDKGALSWTFHVIYQRQVQGLHRGIQTLRNRWKHVLLLFPVYRCWLVGSSYEFFMSLWKTNESSLTCQI